MFTFYRDADKDYWVFCSGRVIAFSSSPKNIAESLNRYISGELNMNKHLGTPYEEIPDTWGLEEPLTTTDTIEEMYAHMNMADLLKLYED